MPEMDIARYWYEASGEINQIGPFLGRVNT